MAKFYGNAVKTGKLGGSVFAIRNGETIERQYQPVVANPSTANQVAVRAKLKLLSQLSAVIAPAIAIRREGAVSPRNLFTKVNYPAVTFASDEASINVPNVQLTRSAVGFSAISASRADSSIAVSVAPGTMVDRVVYVLMSKGSDEKLRYVDSRVVTTPGASGNFEGSFYDVGGELYVLAYGVRDNTDAARAVFGNLISPTAEAVAKIITSRNLLESDITLTETRGIAVPAV